MSFQVAPWASDGENLKRARCEVLKSERLLQCHKEQTQAAAELALRRYNLDDELVVKYTIDTALNSNGFYFNGIHIIHVNFTAKKEGGSESGLSDMFFAEIHCNLDRVFEVLDCVIVDPKETDPEKTCNHCNHCSEHFELPIYHAVEHCRYGYYDEDHYGYVNYSSDSDDCFYTI
ncbi:hypothetical protein LINGRAHAP2_LOCUS25785 [Linum grandiflorum]